MVLGHGVGPLTKPTRERCRQLRALQGMVLNLLPFVFVEGTGLIQNVGVDCYFADVV